MTFNAKDVAEIGGGLNNQTHMTDKQERELAALRRDMELSNCPACGEPYDLEPCNARHARIQQDRIRITPNLGISLKAILSSVVKP